MTCHSCCSCAAPDHQGSSQDRAPFPQNEWGGWPYYKKLQKLSFFPWWNGGNLPRIHSSSIIALLKPVGCRLSSPIPDLCGPPSTSSSLYLCLRALYWLPSAGSPPSLGSYFFLLPLFHLSFTSTAWLYPWLHPPLLHNAAYPITSIQLSPNLLLTCLMQPVLPATYTSCTFGLPWRWREQVALKDW